MRTNAIPANFAEVGIDADALSAQIQDKGAASLVKSWMELMECIVSKSKSHKVQPYSRSRVSHLHGYGGYPRTESIVSRCKKK